MNMNKCESCGKEMDVTGLPKGKYWCGDCEMPIPEVSITDPAEMMKALEDDGFNVGVESPFN